MTRRALADRPTLPQPPLAERTPYQNTLLQALTHDRGRVTQRIEELIQDGVFSERPDPLGRGVFYVATDNPPNLSYDAGDWVDLSATAGPVVPVTAFVNLEDSDHTDGLQAAEDYRDSVGGTLYFPASAQLYVQPASITLRQHFSWRGPTLNPYDLDWTNDWQKQVPTYAGKVPIIQCVAGQHGTILQPEGSDTHGVIVGMCFRSGQGRTSADALFAVPPRKLTMLGSRLENLEYGFKEPASGMYTLRLWLSRFIGMGIPVGGRLYDSLLAHNIFTSSGTCIDLDNSGANRLLGNRCEWSNIGINLKAAGHTSIVGGEFDSCTYTAIQAENADNISIVGPWIRGSGMDGSAAGKRSHLYIKGGCQGFVLSAVNFVAAVEATYGDRPLHILELDNAGTSKIIMSGCSTYDGCVQAPVRATSSGNCLDSDAWDLHGFALTGGGTAGDPNGAADVLASFVGALQSASLYGCRPVVRVYDARAFIAGANASKVYLVGQSGTPLAVNLGGFSVTLERIHNLKVGGLNLYDYGDATHAYSAPSGPSQGTWRAGKKIYHSSPASGGKIGWVNTAASGWKTWGVIS